MHAVAASPDDLYFWDYRSRRFEKRPERLLQSKEQNVFSQASVSSKASRYPDFIRKNSPNPNSPQFAFNLLRRPDDHATKSRSSRAV